MSLQYPMLLSEQIQWVSIEADAAAKYPAVKQMFKVNVEAKESYGFVVSPVGYRAPIQMMVMIDGKRNEVMGIKVLQHDETPEYGCWLSEDWFAKRFQGKSVEKYLKRVILEVKNDNEIIQITGATVTTEAAINGVNAAMGMYRELVLGEEADPVPLKVEGFVTEVL